nr:hypothetical protein [uncultured Dysosmobacter sp.]
MMRIKKREKPCPMRHPENGNCLPIGGFCIDAVSDNICEALHQAYEIGLAAGYARTAPEAPEEGQDAPSEEPTRNCLHCRSYKPAYICDKHGHTVKNPQQAEPPCVLWEKGEA